LPSLHAATVWSLKGCPINKTDFYLELYLFNRNADGLIRVLQRLESFSVRPKHELKAYEVRLEEIRAEFNSEIAEAVATRERSDAIRLRTARAAWEKEGSRRRKETPN
jgi:hypothetical protein